MKLPDNPTSDQLTAIFALTIESVYRDGVDEVLDGPTVDDAGAIRGKFRDGKKLFDVVIAGGVIDFKPSRDNDPDAFGEDEADFALLDLTPCDIKDAIQLLKLTDPVAFSEWWEGLTADFAGRNCVKGYTCGGSCISRLKVCRKTLGAQSSQAAAFLDANLSPDQQARIAALQAQIDAVRGGGNIDTKALETVERETALGAGDRDPRVGTLTNTALDELNFDPNRFQYKLVHGETGASGSLTGVRKWDENLAGVVQVWIDPADGKTYVINGHNRASLARGLGVEEIAVRYIDVPDAAAARATGALTNIAEGRGNALDAAKFMRDSGLSAQDMRDKGVPMKERIASDGIALSQLDDVLFRKVIDGEIPQERAVVIGASGLKPEQQRALSDLVDKEKRSVTNDVLRELVDTVKSSESEDTFQMDLFGGSSETKTNALDKARLQAAIKRRLSREQRLFGTVGKSKAAADLAKAGNQIDVDQSRRMSQEAEVTLRIFDTMKNVSGPVSQRLNEAASRLGKGENSKKVEQEIYESILEDLSSLIK